MQMIRLRGWNQPCASAFGALMRSDAEQSQQILDQGAWADRMDTRHPSTVLCRAECMACIWERKSNCLHKMICRPNRPGQSKSACLHKVITWNTTTQWMVCCTSKEQTLSRYKKQALSQLLQNGCRHAGDKVSRLEPTMRQRVDGVDTLGCGVLQEQRKQILGQIRYQPRTS